MFAPRSLLILAVILVATALLNPSVQGRHGRRSKSHKHQDESLHCGQTLDQWAPTRSSSSSASQRIIGGKDAPIGAFPFFVELEIEFRQGAYNILCGGVILDESHILTTSSCIRLADGTNASLIEIVQIGEKKGEFRYPAREVWSTDWVDENEADLALAVLEDPLQFELSQDGQSINKVCLPDASATYETNSPSVLIGMGVTKQTPSGPQSPNRLQYAKLGLLDSEECMRRADKEDRPHWKIREYHICTSIRPYNGPFACFGDSGSPLLRQTEDGYWELAGIFFRFFFDQLNCKGNGALFSRVANFVEDIKGKMEDKGTSPEGSKWELIWEKP